MEALFYGLVIALVVAQFALPRRLAFAPLLVAICHFRNVPVIDIGVNFSIFKILIVAGLLRAARDQTPGGPTRQPLDLLIAVWAGWMVLSGFAHQAKDGNPITVRLSTIFDFAGGYLYARLFLRDREDFLRCMKCLALVMIPLAVEAFLERALHRNFYALIAGGWEGVGIREGRVRAVGPFGHPILLGSFAATSMILLIPLWHRCRRWMILGSAACVVTVFFSASSGPIVTLFSGLFAVGLWHWRSSVGAIRKVIILGFIGLQLVMQAPVWFLMAKIDLAGGSTGWHRAELISAALNHLGEWWLVGTDYTRDWMPYGVLWSENHIDITNHYLSMGVSGGLLLMLCFIAILVRAFQLLGGAMRPMRLANNPEEFILWCVGAALFAHAFTFISICYFDQTNVGFGFLLGAVPGVCAASVGGGWSDEQQEWLGEGQGGALSARDQSQEVAAS